MRYAGLWFTLLIAVLPVFAPAPAIAEYQDVTALFQLDRGANHGANQGVNHGTNHGAAAYDAVARDLIFLEIDKNGALSELRRINTGHNVYGVTAVADGYLYATGMGRNDLSAPIQIWLLPKSGATPRVVFEAQSERGQVAYLAAVGSKIWLTYFDAKYSTKTGYLSPKPAAMWEFTEVATLRLGDAVDVFGETMESIAIGRPYGDQQGEDGDLLLFENGIRTLLPSYRGVRSVLFLPKLPKTTIVIGDGWHQNYGAVAQARLSLLTKDNDTGRFALQLIDRDKQQYGFSKLIDLTIGGEQYVAALGNRELVVYGPIGGEKQQGIETKKRAIFTRESEDALFDVAIIESSNTKATFVVANRGVKLVPFP